MKPIKFIDSNLLFSEYEVWKDIMQEDRDSFTEEFQNTVRKTILKIMIRGK